MAESKIEYLGTLEEYFSGFRITGYSWQKDQIGYSSIPIYVYFAEEVQIVLICSSDLSSKVRDYDGPSQLNDDGSITVISEDIDLKDHILIRVDVKQRKYVRLSNVQIGFTL